MASGFLSDVRKVLLIKLLTYDPIVPFKELSAVFLPPDIDACIYVGPFRNPPQDALHALDFWSADVRKVGCCVAVEGGQGDIVKVDKPDFGHPSTSHCQKDQLIGRGTTHDRTSMMAAQLPTPPHPTTTTDFPRMFAMPSSPKNA